MLFANLTEDSLVAVQDVIFSIPTYSSLKSKLFDQSEPTSKLLHPKFLENQTPFEMLSYLKADVASDDIS